MNSDSGRPKMTEDMSSWNAVSKLMQKKKKLRSADEAQTDGLPVKAFWESAGADIPAFFDAPSTRYYFECERMLFETCFGDLRGKKILKTDLWDEAKNSRILNWAAAQEAEVYGLDISRPIIREAKKFFGPPARPRRLETETRLQRRWPHLRHRHAPRGPRPPE